MEATLQAEGSAGAGEHPALGLEEQTAAVRGAETGRGSVCSLCVESAGAASLSEGKAEDTHWSASRGEGGESIALPSEETGLAQRPSPCKYRMHFFFLLHGPHQSVCWLRPKRALHFLGEAGSELESCCFSRVRLFFFP